ncbi:hypothetical protein HDZ31DRAFT_15699, partial [Schizophyllum fasciatum]
MVSVPSTVLSLHENTTDVPVIHHRIVRIDASRFRLQVQHLEYYWGLMKGELNFDSSLNHIELRSDMVELLEMFDWTPMPTWETLKRMLAMAKFNMTASLHSRKNFLQEFPDEEFEYDFVPTGMAEYLRPTVYIRDAGGCKAFQVPYKGVPRLRSRAHPFFVLFLADDQVRLSPPSAMPCMKAKRRIDAMTAIINCWKAQPPEMFLIGPDVWKEHRHPMSDDGRAARRIPQSSQVSNSAKIVKFRKVTKAPCHQPKVTTRKSPYTRHDRLRIACR